MVFEPKTTGVSANYLFTKPDDHYLCQVTTVINQKKNFYLLIRFSWSYKK